MDSVSALAGGGAASVLSGIDLLMNPRKKQGSAGSDAGSIASSSMSKRSSVRESLSSGGGAREPSQEPLAQMLLPPMPNHVPSVTVPPPPQFQGKWQGPPTRIGGGDETESGDGYDDDESDIPDESDSGVTSVVASPSRFVHMTPEEVLRKKREILYELARIERKGVQLPRRYTLDDSLDDMRNELDRLRLDRELDVSVRFQRKMLMTCITGIELLNGKFDPFNIKLDGWSDSLHENLGDYDEVFEDLHMKYRGKAKMAPEIKLMMMVAGSGVMFHLTNSMFRTSAATVPGFEDVMRQNPHLMRQYAEAAMNTATSPQPGRGSAGGGLFGNIGSMFGGLFGGGGGGMPSAAPPAGAAPAQVPQQGPMLRGPKPVTEVLHELHRNAFGSQTPVSAMPPLPVNTRPYSDSDRIEIISNASADTHISELADIVPGTSEVPATVPQPQPQLKRRAAARNTAAGKKKTG